ncbi:CBS domain-containing protein [Acidovorax sp. GBBC 3334]|uniref:CBS domain-containing protein n=1 Tax=unclassified Acidovorax TaxID=2684926 RepID=UPI0023022D13|nr:MULTISPECIES: CBS domain-containing protein [unclassified Acidovorax]MDA8457185.1 CBS domain-containing protein [Acidovorax sp. GBBC 3334]MDA8521553.1 CBS domain-containing protein [Acidovorax sp. NCPPB 4044]
MTAVADILKSKAHQEVFTIAPSDSMLDALRLMADKGIGALIVVEGGAIAGIVTERDYARKVALLGRTSGDTRVSEVMTRAVRFVRPTQASGQCLALMSENRLRHLPVVEEDGTLAGLISIGDLVKDVISEQQFLIAQMEQYITGQQRG